MSKEQLENNAVEASRSIPLLGAALPPFNDEVCWILGRPNFMLIRTAHRLRQLGHDIPTKAENEQAACIYWMLSLYVKHGESWRDEAKRYLKAESI